MSWSVSTVVVFDKLLPGTVEGSKVLAERVSPSWVENNDTGPAMEEEAAEPILAPPSWREAS
jgi:hypothetical protein